MSHVDRACHNSSQNLEITSKLFILSCGSLEASVDFSQKILLLFQLKYDLPEVSVRVTLSLKFTLRRHVTDLRPTFHLPRLRQEEF